MCSANKIYCNFINCYFKKTVRNTSMLTVDYISYYIEFNSLNVKFY